MKVVVIGASGYVGAELIALLTLHNKVTLKHLLVSEQSSARGKTFAKLHARWQGICDLPLQSFSPQWFEQHLSSTSHDIDAVFFATPHEFSAQWAQAFLDVGIKVFDLSGGFRLKDPSLYPQHYGFEHQALAALEKAQYGLAEWHADGIANSELIAVPGCYPTASLLALKPITQHKLQQENALIVVNGISGVSGAGRKAALSTSFCEVSLTPYNILQHRHQPEISQEAHADVIFNPHLAPYKRGLLITATVPLKAQVNAHQVAEAFTQAYQGQSLVRLRDSWPKIDDVAYSPFADLYWQVDEEKQVVVVSCAIDNLLKGAAAQAVQCLNISLGLASDHSLLSQGGQG
ncbi:N-acetyl-gamma-glutamyl-phosphate reductase [Colwellia chukchiensis]|uniref:N-acetyl-gamma-glutamyl-phosphate reductase n=1 Tax=Colwellia chukchiensis TaxID=641665 RepID=A0A1H7PRJ0_9GAMM|nr:N-acetyl-gamma-glutamyl-phosphate reductase [Colwellia chukchiensis]SEL38393.1 N-acetyl-gamma-glutamyl-phosphate reductase [Colwellia chukchiensis]